MDRVVDPEILDELPSIDPRAVGSRGDLRRLNALMGHVGILDRALWPSVEQGVPRGRRLRVIELGAGDGTLLLGLAHRWSARRVVAEVTLVDRQNLVTAETSRAFAALEWSVEVVATDVFGYLEQSSAPADVMFANLFLHHFKAPELQKLLGRAALRTNLFAACEPRRSSVALAAARLLRLIGCNAVTRNDAAISVRAGFVGHELSGLWPSDPTWQLFERSAGCFSQCFVAKRRM